MREPHAVAVPRDVQEAVRTLIRWAGDDQGAHRLDHLVGNRHLGRGRDQVDVGRVVSMVHAARSAGPGKGAAVVTPTGFEPVAYRLGICRSILLSYGAGQRGAGCDASPGVGQF